MNSKRRISFLLLVLLGFFGLDVFPIMPTQLDYILLSILVLIVWRYVKFIDTYSKLIGCYLFFVFCSCVYSWYVHHQSLIMVVAHTYQYFGIAFFFYLIHCNLPYRSILHVFLRIAVICCVCYIIQSIIFPVILFRGAEAYIDSDGYRARIPGSICCYFLLMYGVNNFLTHKKFNYILCALLGFIPIIIMGFRTLNALSLIAIFLMIPFVFRKGNKTIVFSFIMALGVFLLSQTGIVQDKLMEMQERNESGQSYSNDNYVRIREFDYYWNTQFSDPVERFWGGGVPSDLSSTYAKQIFEGAYTEYLFWDDLGIVGLCLIIGIPAVLLLVIMYIRCMVKCRESDIQYIRFTLFVLLFGSIMTTAELFREGNILLLSLLLYMEYKYHEEKKLLIK